jgi:DNA-binding Lrp family transcriptional regulator
MIESEANYFRFKLLEGTENDAKTIVTKDTSEREVIDEVDRIILIELSKNARINVNHLANKLKITSVAVAKRIKNLEKKKIILGYKPQLNLNLMHAKIFLSLQKISEEKERQIIYFLSEMPEIISVSKTLGDYELEFRAMVKDVLSLQNLIERIRKNFQEEFIDFNLITFVKFYKLLNYFPISNIN